MVDVYKDTSYLFVCFDKQGIIHMHTHQLRYHVQDLPRLKKTAFYQEDGGEHKRTIGN